MRPSQHKLLAIATRLLRSTLSLSTLRMRRCPCGVLIRSGSAAGAIAKAVGSCRLDVSIRRRARWRVCRHGRSVEEAQDLLSLRRKHAGLAQCLVAACARGLVLRLPGAPLDAPHTLAHCFV